jgi:hypothetical protein
MDHHRVVSLPFGTWPDQFLDHAIVTVHTADQSCIVSSTVSSIFCRHRRRRACGGDTEKRHHRAACSANATRKAKPKYQHYAYPPNRWLSTSRNWQILHADYRRPCRACRDAYDAARGLFSCAR